MLIASLSFASASNNIPEGYAATRYESLWKRSPFTLSSITEDQGPTSAITERYTLGAAYTVGADDYVIVVNRSNPQERLVVTKTPNAQGISLVSISYNNTLPDKTTAIIKQGDETGPVNFDPNLIKAAAAASAAAPMPAPQPARQPTYTPGAPPANPTRMIRRPRIIAPPPGTTSTPNTTPTRP